MLILHGRDRGIQALPYHDHEPSSECKAAAFDAPCGTPLASLVQQEYLILIRVRADGRP